MKKVIKKDNDSDIKIKGLAVLWSMGYTVRPELLLAQESGRRSAAKVKFFDLTDVDVIGYKFDRALNRTTMCIDCGSGKNRSPIERAFWLKGLQEALSLDKTISVVGRRIEEEHRIAAYSFDVVLFDVSEFDEYAKNYVGQIEIDLFYNYYEQYEQWESYIAKMPGMFYDFFRKDNWQRDWHRIPVTVPGQLKRWQANIKLDDPVHQFGLFELATLLSIGLVQMCIFHFETKPEDIREATKQYLYGGARSSKMIERLLKVLQESDRKNAELTGRVFDENANIEVEFFGELIEIASRFTKNICDARLVPQCIQAMQLARIDTSIINFQEYSYSKLDFSPITVKLSLDVFRYLRNASDSKEDFQKMFIGV